MAKWHPASGKWGIFGETSGSKEAKKATKRIDQTIADLESRGQNITGYYQEIGKLEQDALQRKKFSELENFLDQSYNIKTESEERASKTGFKNMFDPNEQMAKDKLKRQRENLMAETDYQSQLQRLNLGQKQQTDLFALEDLIRNLQLERENYS
tara:strand:+ start:3771 stop:4232 length:462 start_codon:yes stop_codon:yes gene_type:complete